jgi:hypothetical protein
VLSDGQLERGLLLQRLEAELAPESRLAALRLRLERRVTADRSYENFAQTLDERSLAARWRARPGAALTSEVEARLKRQAATQQIAGSRPYERTLGEEGALGQLIWTPGARLRAVAALEASRTRPEGQSEYTRTVRIGPDLGLAVGSRGRADLSVRRSFVSGAPPVSIIPTSDPAGAPRWEGTGRFDFRMRDIATAGLSMSVRERPGRKTVATGRAELRVFF